MRNQIVNGSRSDLKKIFDSDAFVVHLLIAKQHLLITKQNEEKQAKKWIEKNPILLRRNRKDVVLLSSLTIIQCTAPGNRAQALVI